MTSFTLKLGNDFLHVPELTLDRKNWVIYKDRLTLSVQACGLGGHLDRTATKLMEPTVTQASANRELTAEEEKITMYIWRQLEGMVPEGSHCLAASCVYDFGLALSEDQEKAKG